MSATEEQEWTSRDGMVVPDEVVDAARSLLDFIDGTPPASDVYAVALYVLQEKASSFRRATKDAGKQVDEVPYGTKTKCPICEELAPVHYTQTWFPGTHAYRCSSGHAWMHDIKP